MCFDKLASLDPSQQRSWQVVETLILIDAISSWRTNAKQLHWVQQVCERTSQEFADTVVRVCLDSLAAYAVRRRIKRQQEQKAAKQCCATAWRQAASHWHNWAMQQRGLKKLNGRTLHAADFLPQCFQAWLHYLNFEKHIRDFTFRAAQRWAESSVRHSCGKWFSKVLQRRRRRELVLQSRNRIKGRAFSCWQYGTAQWRGLCEIAVGWRQELAYSAAERCFKEWHVRAMTVLSFSRQLRLQVELFALSSVIEGWLCVVRQTQYSYDATTEFALQRSEHDARIFLQAWQGAARTERRKLRLTLQVVNRVACKRQRAAIRHWHSDTTRRIFLSTMERRAATPLALSSEKRLWIDTYGLEDQPSPRQLWLEDQPSNTPTFPAFIDDSAFPTVLPPEVWTHFPDLSEEVCP